LNEKTLENTLRKKGRKSETDEKFLIEEYNSGKGDWSPATNHTKPPRKKKLA